MELQRQQKSSSGRCRTTYRVELVWLTRVDSYLRGLGARVRANFFWLFLGDLSLAVLELAAPSQLPAKVSLTDLRSQQASSLVRWRDARAPQLA